MIVASSPGGIRYAQLVDRISVEHPETPTNTIHGSVYDLQNRFPKEIGKPSRGLFVSQQAAASAPATEPIFSDKDEVETKAVEKEFYAPFADWLRSDLDEVTVAYPFGGAAMLKKWGTPDVVGVYKPLASHRIKFDVEIVTAEIKIDPQQAVVAFGQAVAYRLFSNKTYLVMPQSMSPDDYSRLEALAMLFGLGFVTFDATSPSKPNFRIVVRGQRFSPDMFYVNEFAERLFQVDPDMFNKIFG